MTFERSYMNWTEGFGICCWDAPSREKLQAIFEKVGAPFDKIIPVEEHAAHSLVS